MCTNAGGLDEIGKRGQSEYAQFLRRASLEQSSPTATGGASPDISPTRRDSNEASARLSLDWVPPPRRDSIELAARQSLEWLPPSSNAPARSGLERRLSQSFPKKRSPWRESDQDSLQWQAMGSYDEGAVQQHKFDHSMQGSEDALAAQLPQQASRGGPDQNGGEFSNALRPAASQPDQADVRKAGETPQNSFEHLQGSGQPQHANGLPSYQSPFSISQPQQTSTQPGMHQQAKSNHEWKHFGHQELPAQEDGASTSSSEQVRQLPQPDQSSGHGQSDPEQRRLTFQEILLQQLKEHSHQVSAQSLVAGFNPTLYVAQTICNALMMWSKFWSTGVYSNKALGECASTQHSLAWHYVV